MGRKESNQTKRVPSDYLTGFVAGSYARPHCAIGNL